MKITKRDWEFDKKIKKLPNDWLDYHQLMLLENKELGMAEQWKFIVHHVQRDAAKSLFYANSNQHPFGHKMIKKNNRIVFSSQIIQKAFYLRYCILLLQACGDKLAQMIRWAMNISTWKLKQNKRIKKIKATDDTTSLTMLARYLKLHKRKDKAILKEIDAYLKNDSVGRIVFQLANEIKHKWTTSYQGEGLYPFKKPMRQEQDKSGKMFDVLTISMENGINIDRHIKDALVTNNLFVDLAIKLDALLKKNLKI